MENNELKVTKEKYDEFMYTLAEMTGSDVGVEILREHVKKLDLTSDTALDSKHMKLFELLSFTMHMTRRFYSEKVITINEQIADGISKLSRMGMYPNLKRIAEHAIGEVIKIHERDIEALEEKGDFEVDRIERLGLTHSKNTVELMKFTIAEQEVAIRAVAERRAAKAAEKRDQESEK